jgi:hypothetical protein
MPGEQSLDAESEEPKPSPTCASGDTRWPSICFRKKEIVFKKKITL